MSPEEHEAFLLTPALEPPPGIVSNLINPKNDFAVSFPLFVFVISLCSFVYGIKVFSQYRVVRKVFVEDYFLALSWLLLVGGFAPVGSLICFNAVGVHQWDMTKATFARHHFLFNISVTFYCLVLMFAKLNILLQYLRIFVPPGTRDFTYWASHILIWMTIGYYIPWTFMNMFICTPRRKLWDLSVEGGHCINWIAVSFTGNVLDAISDILILVLPQRVIFRLQMSPSRKLSVSALFTIGIFACVASFVRIYYMGKIIQDASDTTFNIDKVSFWATIQLVCIFLAACLPGTPMAVKHIAKQPWALRFGSSLSSLLRSSKSAVKSRSAQLTTIGGGNRRPIVKKVVTDIEFEELVGKTDLSSVTVFPHRVGVNREGEDNA